MVANNQQFRQEQLGNNIPPFFGWTPGGFNSMGDDSGYRGIPADEDLDDPNGHDPLVVIPPKILQRPMYYDMGFTRDPKMYLRKPALNQLKNLDEMMVNKVGWRPRVCDPFRPATVQQQGFCWGISEVVKNEGKMTIEQFKELLRHAVTTGVTVAETQKLMQYVTEADMFFSFVKVKSYDKSRFPNETPEDLVTAAANLGIIDLPPLDLYGPGSHVHGGIVDLEFVDDAFYDWDGNGPKTSLVNLGVPVDLQGLESAFPFFEREVAPILEGPLKAAGIPRQDFEARMAYYSEQVQKKPALAKYLLECGIDPDTLKNRSTFLDFRRKVRSNRRIVLAMTEAVGMKAYGLESWHFDCNDAIDGKRVTRANEVSGGGTYAVYMGQMECAWGNAMRLWERATR